MGWLLIALAGISLLLWLIAIITGVSNRVFSAGQGLIWESFLSCSDNIGCKVFVTKELLSIY